LFSGYGRCNGFGRRRLISLCGHAPDLQGLDAADQSGDQEQAEADEDNTFGQIRSPSGEIIVTY
jgi:hypothetical protein